MQWGRTALVHQSRVGAIVDEGADGIRATRANGSMQRGDPAVVHGVRIRAGSDEVNDHLALRVPIPTGRTRTPSRTRPPICGVVERFGSPSVTSPNVRAVRDDE